MSIDLTVTSDDLGRLSTALERYAHLSGKTLDDVLDKKGRDLSIRLFNLYRNRQWGGPARSSRLAEAELRARTAAGLGTRVRTVLRREYEKERARILHERHQAGLVGSLNKHLRTIRQAVALWAKFVGKEVGLRQKGIGVLAAGWLWYRRRSSQARGVYYVKNRTGRSRIGRVERGDGFLRITNLRNFADELDARHGLSRQAINGSIADMEIYTARKAQQDFTRVLSGAGLKVAA